MLSFQNETVVLDGGLSTALELLGHDLADGLWSARLLRDDPAAIVAAHAAFYGAGARVAITASYQASFEGFAAVGIAEDEAESLLRMSVMLARRAATDVGGEGLLVAASVGPYGAMLASGQEYTGDYGEVGPATLRAFHARRIAVLVDAGADLLAVETIPRADEAAAIVDLLRSHPTVPAWISFSCRDGESTSDGTPFEDAVAEAVRAPNVVAVGINCTAPEHVGSLLARARRATSLPLVVYPNAGRTWNATARAWEGAGAVGFSAEMLASWREGGASLIGGCCGVAPDGIRAIAAALERP